MIRILKISLLVLLIGESPADCQSWVKSSVLANGKWFRIAITKEGIYRIDYSRLKQLGLDNPSYPTIYTNNSGQLSYYNDGTAPDDLKQIAVWISGNGSKLADGDFLLFYAKGTGRWKYNQDTKQFSHVTHNYCDTAFYFLSSDTAPGKIPAVAEIPAGTVSYTTSESDAFFVYEKDQENLIKSGREWFQRINSLTIDPEFSDLLISEGIRYRMRVAARSSIKSGFTLSDGAVNLRTIRTDPVNLFDFTGTYASIADSSGSAELHSASPVFTVGFDNYGQSGAYGWLDFLELNARRSNIFRTSPLYLSDIRSVEPGGITECSILSPADNMQLWDVTDPWNIQTVPFSQSGTDVTFRYRSDSLRIFAAFTPGQAIVPEIRSIQVENQDLHGSPPAEMIIITHPLFSNYATRLAELHADRDGMQSVVVTPQKIYNEFSGGTPDICAIRNFVRMKYLNQKGSDRPLRYLLLFGDGSYENRTPPPGNPCFIPTYQSPNSNIFTASFTSDDFYALLDEGEGESEGTEDVGTGRLTVSDTSQAGAVLNKIIRYLVPSSSGDWKNIVCLAADDEDGNIHMADAEGLESVLHDSVPFINTEKIYLDAFREQTSASGQSYPDVNKAISDEINSGCLIFNYIGHGNESGLAHERVVRTEDINSWKNLNRLPLFITATCEFSRFDDMDINIISGAMTGKTSAGEMVLLNTEGGGIALMSTTRLVYSAPNYALNRNILGCAFETDAKGQPLRLGDIIRIAKNRTGDGPNKRNFTLLGDPALQLAWPWHGRVITDSVNSRPVTDPTDTLSALSVINVSGHVESNTGSIASKFNGIVSPRVFDKRASIKTLANDGGEQMEYSEWKNTIFSGKTKAENGRFTFSFIVPHDIDYSFGTGRISYYAGENGNDMTGDFSNIIVGGFSGAPGADTTGPVIRLFMNDTLFRNGGITDAKPRLLALISDRNGINSSGVAIGHDLEGFTDDDRNAAFNLNDYFENDFDSYTSGRISYDAGPFTAGRHTITVMAWDNFNNSSEAVIAFNVEDAGKLILRNSLSYPNPFTRETRITAGHNRPDDYLDVTVNIYSSEGRKIRILREEVNASGYLLPPLIWDGTLDGGRRAGKGLYLYTITVKTIRGETAEISGKMIIL
jgi:hypothetical protein